MPEIKYARSKVKKVLPAIVLASTFYYSFLMMLGLVLGYFGAKIYCLALNIDENSDRRIFVDCGNGKFIFTIGFWEHWCC